MENLVSTIINLQLLQGGKNLSKLNYTDLCLFGWQFYQIAIVYVLSLLPFLLRFILIIFDRFEAK